jgi:cytochrome c oxidase cbb3-type subunit 3|tara:strand:+ start:565 stop:1431 length:867 start_codon:yes stop_codon:yes gene_type:complete
MPTKKEKDAISGTMTTGHEWDGIKELDTPMPRWWLYVLFATIIWSVGYYFFYPSIPYISGYTKGILGYNSRVELAEKMQQASAAQASFYDGISKSTTAEITQDQTLLTFSLAGGKAAFADNCAACHGPGGAGQKGFPILADDAWIWGGSLEDIQTTITHGIRWTEDEDTRISEMPAFGEFMERGEVDQIAEYVLSLSGRSEDAAAVQAGQGLFSESCSSCHGDGGTGLKEFGAPNLSDQIWFYGGEKADIVAQITKPRLGVMPAWQGRLDENTIKMLTVYIYSLGGGQ